MKLRPMVAGLAICVLAVACANSSTVQVPGGSSGDPTYPTGASDVVLRVSVGGGFVAPSYSNAQIPGFSLFGDGRAITTGAQTEIYPQPALPPVLVSTVDRAGILTIVRAALDAGLGHNASYTDIGSVGIADAPSTTFTLAANGQTHTVVVYALGELGSKPASMSEQEYSARQALQRFASQVSDLTTLVPTSSVTGAVRYVPTTMRLFVSPYRPDPSLTEPPIDWPGSTPLATFGAAAENQPGTRCGTVSGADLEKLLPLAETANQLTPWVSERGQYSLVFRPLLPDETGC